jgi:hypothetical protein
MHVFMCQCTHGSKSVRAPQHPQKNPEIMTESSILSEVDLWRAVLMQAMKDMARTPCDATRRSDDNCVGHYRRTAITWALTGSDYFKMVCWFAGFDPAKVQTFARQCKMGLMPRDLSVFVAKPKLPVTARKTRKMAATEPAKSMRPCALNLPVNTSQLMM